MTQPGAWGCLQTHAGGVRAAKAEWLRRCGTARDLLPLDVRWELTADKLLARAREQASSGLLAGGTQQSSGAADAAEQGTWQFIYLCYVGLPASRMAIWQVCSWRLEARLQRGFSRK